MAGLIGKTKNRILRSTLNAIAWKTKQRIIVFESDDWGSIRMASKDAYQHFLQLGLPVDKCVYNSFDSLESNTDLEGLFNVLNSVKDFNGRPARFTPNVIVANPDFDAIMRSNYEEYFFEPFIETLNKYPNHDKVYSLYLEGLNNDIFYPQFHGREHINVARWMNDLRNQDQIAAIAFDHNMFSVAKYPTSSYKTQYMDSFGTDQNGRVVDLSHTVLTGLDFFQKLFGYLPDSFIAPCYKYTSSLNSVLKSKGIKYIQGSWVQLEPSDKVKKGFTKNYHYTGQKNDLGQIFMVRNCIFEVSENPELDWVGSCLKEIENAFFWNTPAIISTHRVNYMGGIDHKNRTRGLRQLSLLLKGILKNWPDVVFLSSDELGLLIDKN